MRELRVALRLMRSLIVFDLDGTLVDSQRDLADSANDMLAAYGAEPLDVGRVAAMVGDGARQLVVRALDAAGVAADVPEALDRFLSIYSERLFIHTRPYPSIPDVVEALSARSALAVLTNKPEAFSCRLLDGFGLSRHFQTVVGGDSGFPRKPDPAGLRHLIGLAAAGPPATLMVGDSMVDVETARQAGTRVCVARYGFGHLRTPIDVRPGELVAERPEDLADVVRQFLQATGL
jgi:phosphoglycolate phosphatase